MSGEFIMDWDRTARTGVAEAVICAHKSAPQIAAIAQDLCQRGRRQSRHGEQCAPRQKQAQRADRGVAGGVDHWRAPASGMDGRTGRRQGQ